MGEQFENEELSFEDLGLSDLDEEAVEEVSENIFLSDSRRELTVHNLKKVRDSYIQLVGLNRSISVFLKAGTDLSAQQLKKQRQKNATTEDNNNILMKTCREQILSKLPKLRKEVEDDKKFNQFNFGAPTPGGFTVADAAYIADSIPESLGRSDYIQMVENFKSKHKSDYDSLTLDEKAKLLDRLNAILYYCDVDNKTQDSEEGFDSKPATSYEIPTFNLVGKIVKIQKVIDLLSTSVKPGDIVPDIYTISQAEKINDLAQGKEFLKYNLDLYFSNRVDAPEMKEIYRSIDFQNQMHLVGISNIRKRATGDKSLLEWARTFVPHICKELDIKDYAAEFTNIIEVPYCITGKFDSGEEYIVIGDEMSKFTPETLANSPATGFDNFKTFLQDAVAKRTTSEDLSAQIWYSCVTASSVSTPDIIHEVNNKPITEGLYVLYSDDELLELAKSRNAKKFILNDYAELQKDDHYTSPDPDREEVLMRRDKELAKHLERIHGGEYTFSCDNTLTHNRSIIMQTIMQHITTPIKGRCDIEDIFNANKVDIMKVVVTQIISKVGYDREVIGNIFGSNIVKSSFYTYIKDGSYASDPNFEVKLQPIDIIDSLSLVYKLRARGFLPQDYTSDVIIKRERIGDTVDDTEYTQEEFIREMLNILTLPNCLNEAWGIVPTFHKGVSKVNKCYHDVLLALVEAYQIYNMLLANDRLQSIMPAEDTPSINKDGDLDLKAFRYNKPLAPADFNTYITVAKKYNTLSEDFYNKYSEYLQSIINRYFTDVKPIRTEFDGGMIVNAYIEVMAESSTYDKSLTYKLFMENKGLSYDLDNLDSKVSKALDEVEFNADCTLSDVMSILGLESKLDEDDSKRLVKLFDSAKSLVNLSSIPLIELLKTLQALSNEGSLEKFSEESYNAYIHRLGFNCNDSDGVQMKKHDLVEIEYSPANLKALIEEGKNLYVTRDIQMMNKILSSVKFNSWVKSLENVSTLEEWKKSYDAIKSVIKSKVQVYSADKVTKTLDNICNKISTFVDVDSVRKALESYINMIAPTEIDAAFLLNYINTTITDLVSDNKKKINVGSLKLESISLEELKALEDELAMTRRKNDFTILLSPFLPTEDVITANQELADLESKLSQIIVDNKEDEVETDIRTVKKSIALYQKYLQTGDTKYKKEINIDDIPFEILTLDMPAKYKLSGPYSKHNLITDHGLVDPNDLNMYNEMINAPFITLFESIMEGYPAFYDDCPRAIRHYIANCRAQNLSK